MVLASTTMFLAMIELTKTQDIMFFSFDFSVRHPGFLVDLCSSIATFRSGAPKRLATAMTFLLLPVVQTARTFYSFLKVAKEIYNNFIELSWKFLCAKLSECKIPFKRLPKSYIPNLDAIQCHEVFQGSRNNSSISKCS